MLKRPELSLGARLERGLWPKALNKPPVCGAGDDATCDGCTDVKLLEISFLLGTAKGLCVKAFTGLAELDCSAKMDDGCAGLLAALGWAFQMLVMT